MYIQQLKLRWLSFFNAFKNLQLYSTFYLLPSINALGRQGKVKLSIKSGFGNLR